MQSRQTRRDRKSRRRAATRAANYHRGSSIAAHSKATEQWEPRDRAASRRRAIRLQRAQGKERLDKPMGAFVLDSPWIGQSYTPPTPLDIGTIEAAIVSRLSAQITMVEIAHFPDKPEAYRMTHRIGAALIRYEGAEYGAVIDSGAIVQERTLKFEVTLMMRDLGWSVGGPPGGGDPGAYAMIESIRGALTGFQVPGCDKTYPLRERFIK